MKRKDFNRCLKSVKMAEYHSKVSKLTARANIENIKDIRYEIKNNVRVNETPSKSKNGYHFNSCFDVMYY